MHCPNCTTSVDYVVEIAAMVAKWLLIAAAATGVGIKIMESRNGSRRAKDSGQE